jgi:hypothetical protein
MEIFRCSKALELQDSVFGVLKWRQNQWHTELPSPAGLGIVLLSLERGRSGPMPEDRLIQFAVRGGDNGIGTVGVPSKTELPNAAETVDRTAHTEL